MVFDCGLTRGNMGHIPCRLPHVVYEVIDIWYMGLTDFRKHHSESNYVQNLFSVKDSPV